MKKHMYVVKCYMGSDRDELYYIFKTEELADFFINLINAVKDEDIDEIDTLIESMICNKHILEKDCEEILDDFEEWTGLINKYSKHTNSTKEMLQITKSSNRVEYGELVIY